MEEINKNEISRTKKIVYQREKIVPDYDKNY